MKGLIKMMQKLSIDKRVSIYGSKKEVELAEQIITALPELPQMDEPKARLSLQHQMDSKKLKASILINGNSVWSFDRIIRDIKAVKRNGMERLSDYLYKFLSLSCGSIAHYNKAGWIDVYPTIEHLRCFFRQNEFGQRVKQHLPHWNTDAIRIVAQIENILHI